jgi:hypothetical protein
LGRFARARPHLHHLAVYITSPAQLSGASGLSPTKNQAPAPSGAGHGHFSPRFPLHTFTRPQLPLTQFNNDGSQGSLKVTRPPVASSLFLNPGVNIRSIPLPPRTLKLSCPHHRHLNLRDSLLLSTDQISPTLLSIPAFRYPTLPLTCRVLPLATQAVAVRWSHEWVEPSNVSLLPYAPCMNYCLNMIVRHAHSSFMFLRWFLSWRCLFQLHLLPITWCDGHPKTYHQWSSNNLFIAIPHGFINALRVFLLTCWSCHRLQHQG